MTEIMHHVRKYANGRLYDVTQKRYITMKDIEDFVRTGVIFNVVLSKSDEDITDSVIAKVKEEMKTESGKKTKTRPKIKTKVKPKIQAKQKPETKSETESGPSELKSIFSQLLLMGSGIFTGYSELWHSVMNMAEEEIEKRVKQLAKAKDLSESEAGHMKKEVIGFVRNLKNWVGANVEERIHDVISTMNLATRSQVEELAEKIDGVNIKLAMLERMESEREDSPEGIGS
jgi:polyhydroxyalkanoate synthesis regulator phasin